MPYLSQTIVRMWGRQRLRDSGGAEDDAGPRRKRSSSTSICRTAAGSVWPDGCAIARSEGTSAVFEEVTLMVSLPITISERMKWKRVRHSTYIYSDFWEPIANPGDNSRISVRPCSLLSAIPAICSRS